MNPLDVYCPACHVNAGQRCIHGVTGEEREYVHVARFDAAAKVSRSRPNLFDTAKENPQSETEFD